MRDLPSSLWAWVDDENEITDVDETMPSSAYARAWVDAVGYSIEEYVHWDQYNAAAQEGRRYRAALEEAASYIREIHSVVIGGGCDEHDDALRALIWAQRAEAAIGLALDDTDPEAEEATT